MIKLFNNVIMPIVVLILVYNFFSAGLAFSIALGFLAIDWFGGSITDTGTATILDQIDPAELHNMKVKFEHVPGTPIDHAKISARVVLKDYLKGREA